MGYRHNMKRMFTTVSDMQLVSHMHRAFSRVMAGETVHMDGGHRVDLIKEHRRGVTRKALLDCLHVLDEGTSDEQDQVEHAVLNCLVARQNTKAKPSCVSAWGAGLNEFGGKRGYYRSYVKEADMSDGRKKKKKKK